jgi:hypothetical protein
MNRSPMNSTRGGNGYADTSLKLTKPAVCGAIGTKIPTVVPRTKHVISCDKSAMTSSPDAGLNARLCVFTMSALVIIW